jgi:hypothetical protein
MNDVILISYNPFARESEIFICKNGKSRSVAISSDLDDLAKKVISLAYENEIFSVKSKAPYETSFEIKQLINEYDSLKKITVEGI